MDKNNLSGITNAMGSINDAGLKKNNSSDKSGDVWLPAPQNVIVEPVGDGGGEYTVGGKTYSSKKDYFDHLLQISDQTDEAKNLRQAWSNMPYVTIDNGKLQLNGSKEFLETDAAKQLREIFKEMEGYTYNTEQLNEQIESWNNVLAQMSVEYMGALDSLNSLNYNISQSARNAYKKSLSFEDYRKIANSAAIGQRTDARTTDQLIFVGYDWDDEGNATPRYVPAKEFFEEFNAVDDDAKRSAFSGLLTQAAEGDVAALSKMFYLQGGSESGPANVDYSAWSTIKDFVGTESVNFLSAISKSVNSVFKYTPFGIPRWLARAGYAFSEQDASKILEDDFIDKKIDDFAEVVNWQNSYLAQLTPTSTGIAATIGNIKGSILGIAYSIWAGRVGNEAVVQSVSGAISAANTALRATGKFTEYTVSASGAVGKLQNIANIDQASGMVNTAGQTVTNLQTGGVQASFLVPTALAEAAPKFTEALAKMALYFETVSGVGAVGSFESLAGTAGSDVGIFTASASGFTEAGATALTPAVYGSVSGGASMFVLGAKELNKIRMQAEGLRIAMNLSAYASQSVLRYTDEYFNMDAKGEEVGDLGQYLATNVIRDTLIGAGLMVGGTVFKNIRDAAKASGTPPTKIVDAAQATAGSSQASFYSSLNGTYSSGSATVSDVPFGEDPIDTSIVKTASSIITSNGEALFSSGVEKPTVIPGSQGGAVFGGVSATQNAIFNNTVQTTPDGFVLRTTSTDVATGAETTTTKFFNDLDDLNKYVESHSVSSVNPQTLANADMAAQGNVVPFNIGGVSGAQYIPDGTSRIQIRNDVSYLSPNEYLSEAQKIIDSMPQDIRLAYEGALAVEDVDSITQQMGAGPALDAPELTTPLTPEDAVKFAQSVARVQAVAAANPNSAPIMPVRVEPTKGGTYNVVENVTRKVYTGGYTQTEFDMPEHDAANLIRSSETNEYNVWTEVAPNALVYAFGSQFLPGARTSGEIQNEYSAFVNGLKGKAKKNAEALQNLLDVDDLINTFTPELNVIFDGVVNSDGTNTGSPLFVPDDSLNKSVAELFDEYKDIMQVEPKYTRRPVSIDTVRLFLRDDAISILERGLKYKTFAILNSEFDYDTDFPIDKAEKLLEKERNYLIERFEDVKKYVDSKKTGAEDSAENVVRAIHSDLNDLRESFANKSINNAVNNILKDGTPAKTDFTIRVEDINDKAAIARMYLFRPHKDTTVVHVPKGTKGSILYDAQDIKVVVLDTSNGYRTEGGEIYINKPNGEPFTPTTLDYNFTEFMDYGDDISGYDNMGKEILTRVNTPGASDKEYTKSHNGENLYEITKPSGIVNGINKVLRERGISEDSLSDRLKYIDSTSYLTPYTGGEPRDIYNMVRDLFLSGGEGYGDFVREGSPLAKALNDGTVPEEYIADVKSILSDIENYASDFGVRDIEFDESGRMVSNYQFSEDLAAKEDIYDKLTGLVEKYNNVLPKGYSDTFSIIRDNVGRGSHEVTGTEILWTHRGLNDTGNGVNAASADNPYINAQPGDHITTNDFPFTSLNQFVPFAYTGGGWRNETKRVVLTIGSPKGTEILYYGNDGQGFTSRGHSADGGAIVIPYGAGMTVVSRVELGDNIVWLTLVRDNPDGTPYSGPIDGEVAVLSEEMVNRPEVVQSTVASRLEALEGDLKDIQSKVDIARQNISDIDQEIQSANNIIEDSRNELGEYLPQQDPQFIATLDYSDRLKLGEDFVRNNPDYMLMYRVQRGGADSWHANNRGMTTDAAIEYQDKATYTKPTASEIKATSKDLFSNFYNDAGELDFEDNSPLTSLLEQVESGNMSIQDAATTPQFIQASAGMTDTAPTTTFDSVKGITFRKSDDGTSLVNKLRDNGYKKLSQSDKSQVDEVDNWFTQEQNHDMVLYRGEPLNEYNNNLKVGDTINSTGWTFVSPSKDYGQVYTQGFTQEGTSVQDWREGGGIIYRYHTKEGQPVIFPYEGTNDGGWLEWVLPRNINAKITNIEEVTSAEPDSPDFIIDVEVELSGITGGEKVEWGEGETDAISILNEKELANQPDVVSNVSDEYQFVGMGGELGGAVWLTADKNWVEGPEKATAGIEGADEVSTVVIPVKKSDILDLGTEDKAWDTLNNSDKKLVKTRGIDGGLKESEYILNQNKNPEVFSDGMQNLLDQYNKNLAADPLTRRAIKNIESNIQENEQALQILNRDKESAKNELSRLEQRLDTLKTRQAQEQGLIKNIVVTEYGLPKKWFTESDIDSAIEYKNENGARAIYRVDENETILDRPPVTMDSIYLPGIRGENAVAIAMEPNDYANYKPDVSAALEKFNGLLSTMKDLKDSPSDYTQGIVEIAQQVKDVYDGLSAVVDMNQIYEDYARQIAEGVEQPTVPDNIKEQLKPLTDMLNSLGKYFDPSGKSLTQDFYLPTGAPSNKLVAIEDILNDPDNVVDPDDAVDGDFDSILVDPLRVGNQGFWEKRSGELFKDEDGNFTMAKAGTLEENLMAYTVSALTRGQNKLVVAAQNEAAFSKYDKNRHQITVGRALKGLKSADANRSRIRAMQLKNARSLKKSLKMDKLGNLKEDYTDAEIINAISEAYNTRNFAKDIDYTRKTNESAKQLGYRQTLAVHNIKGSNLRFGDQTGMFKGIANDIRKASHINVTGTKWVWRKGDGYVNVGFGLSPNQQEDYGFTRTENAVNMGDSALMMFNPERTAAAMFQQLSGDITTMATQGSWELMSKITDFAVENFPLIKSPQKEASRLLNMLVKNANAYGTTAAANVANLSDMTDWVKRNATANINAIIQMADLSQTDDRTIGAIDQIMALNYVGSAVYQSRIVSAMQQWTYSATLAFNPSPAVGNLLSEPERIVDVFGYKIFAKTMTKIVNPKEIARVKSVVGDLPSRFNDNAELVGLAEKAKTTVGRAADALSNAAYSPLQKSEEAKNLMFWIAAEENAKLMYPDDPSAQLQNTLRMFNDAAISGGAGTTPGVASSNFGRAAFILKTFTLRNWDDFIEMAEQIGYGRSGSYKWDKTNTGRETGGKGGYSSNRKDKQKFDYKKAGRFVGGTLLRRYLLWLFVLGPLGRSIWDALGGDPTGLTENTSRGLYDDEGTDEYEGMTPIDNIINYIPTGFIFGTLKDFYFAARRAGVETGNFFGDIDIDKDDRLKKDLTQHLPLGAITRRVGDMLNLLDRGYSFNSYGNKTYAAPETVLDTVKGFALGKSTTSNSLAYNKFRYGSTNIWGDLFDGDWLDFAITANPFAGDLTEVGFDTTRTNYNGVFDGSWNDITTMQTAVADLRKRRLDIINGYNQDLEKYTGEFAGLGDKEKKALATKRKEEKIDAFTEDVTRLVDEFQSAGNALSDQQITTLMYLFDFNEGDDDTYDSQIARERYVEAGLPDYSVTPQTAKLDKETGETTEQGSFQRSLVVQNAVQGRYGIPRDAAKAVDSALADFKATYKSYKDKVTDLNNKAYSAAKGSAERKRLQAEVEEVQNEYLEQLYKALTPVVERYGTEVLSSNDVIESLQPYMSSMIPYSSIKKYGLTYNSGNDIVWGQLSDWVKGRWGAKAPTGSSDKEITEGLKDIKSLIDGGKTSQAKSKARLLLDRIARGSLSARDADVKELRRILYE